MQIYYYQYYRISLFFAVLTLVLFFATTSHPARAQENISGDMLKNTQESFKIFKDICLKI